MSLCIKMLRTLYIKSYKNQVILSGLQTYKSFHCNAILQIKMYMEHENKYAYNIMESKGYVSNIYSVLKKEKVPTKEEFEMILNDNWSKKSSTQIFEAFSELGIYTNENSMCISNKIFDSFIDNLTENIKHATDQELKNLFYSLLKWPETKSIRTRNYIEVWVALDDECLNRLKSWSFDEALSFVALFYMLNVTRASEFSTKALNKISTKSKQLTPSQLVQTVFFVGIMRRSPFDMHNVELQMDKLFSDFTLDELAIMSMGFFKSKTPIRNTDLIIKILNKVTENSKEIHEVSLAALLKIIRYSLKLNSDNVIYKLLDTLQYEIPRLSTMCNVHLALVGMATLTLHKDCLEKIAESTITDITKTRLKDLERLVLTYGTLNFVPDFKENFIEKILEELRKPERINEINKHGRSFACCIAYLGHLGIYPVDLMSIVLSKEFLIQTYGKQVLTYGREVLAIHNTALLFCSQAEMNRLTDRQAIILSKKYTDYVPCESFKKQYNSSEKLMLEVMRTLRESRGGEDYVIGDHIVTHHQRGDLIVCNDDSGSPVPVKESFAASQFGLLRRPPDHNSWVALVIAGRNALIHNTDEATGPFLAKLREIEALGFSAALVLASKYKSLDTEKAKANYLNNLIIDAIKSKSMLKNIV